MEAKREYGNRIQGCFEDMKDSRSLWHGIQQLTNYKTKSAQCDDSTQFLDNLNTVYGMCEEKNNLEAVKLLNEQKEAVLNFSDMDVRNQLRKVNPRKAAGPDNNLGNVLKGCADQLSIVLMGIFYTSLVQEKVPTCFKVTNIIPLPKKVLHYVKNVNFKTKAGEEVFFDMNGDPPAVFDILNQQISQAGISTCANVGSFHSRYVAGKEIVINTNAIKWNSAFSGVPQSVCSESCSPGYRKSAQKGQPVCCFDCVLCHEGEFSNQTDSAACMKCPDDQWSNAFQNRCIHRIAEFLSYDDPLGITLSAVSIFCSLVTASVLYVFIKYRGTPIVKANNRALSYFLLISIMLSFLCALIFIGNPVTVTCMLRQVFFGTVFSFCITCVLAKTVTVVIAFNATKPGSKMRKWIGPKIPIYIIILSSLIQVLLTIVWLVTSPPFKEYNMKSTKDKIIIECNEGSIVMFYCMLGYLGILAKVSFVVAFLARKLPDNFNETKHITFSIVAFACVWISFVPAYLSAKGRYVVALEIFAILSSAAGLLCCIFAPKCYVIMLRPEMNTKEYLMRKL
ncbi:vomeronasal type-2 receptor 26-like [Protopterus annectens]|uniref:vomeronasal type-2 receptor 26-like n=1 Tax=Protopterus annectens TaxID=7888 RepID=UPI001CFC26A9|nr:vomeronasal type-2 receptor 26-like [Protopterus annectens]